MSIDRRRFLLGLTAAPLFAAAEESDSSVERRVFEAINFQRVCVDCGPLQWDSVLAGLARSHSRRMLEGGFFGHVDPKFGDLAARLDAARVTYARSGENVFWEKGCLDPASRALVEWMYSPGHRKNLLTAEFELTGVGVAVGEDGRVAITQQFLVEPPPLSIRSRIIRLPS